MENATSTAVLTSGTAVTLGYECGQRADKICADAGGTAVEPGGLEEEGAKSAPRPEDVHARNIHACDVLACLCAIDYSARGSAHAAAVRAEFLACPLMPVRSILEVEVDSAAH
ncbi:hypothetical protein B0H11DRAFT_2260578 [Mycena galericulata]|nr:hypothetical protein B0H11DRAFT_2260578 [Mycena galericulata]